MMADFKMQADHSATWMSRQSMARRLSVIVLTGCLSLPVLSHPGYSATNGVPFSVNLADRQYCLINVLQQPGIFTPNVALTELSSKNPGGLPGMIDVQTTNGSFDLSIDTPISFTLEPPGGGASTDFSATMTGISFSGSGSGTFGETTAQTSLKRGLTTVMVHFIATRTAGTFPPGNYASVVTMRCE